MDKKSLRSQLKAERLALNSNDVSRKSHAMLLRVINVVPWQKVNQLHCFTTLTALNEPDTEELFDYIWNSHPHISTYTVLNKEGSWRHGRVTREGFFETFLPQLEVIIVPLLGFDSQNNRLGFGGGFYDRFLATQPLALKIGLGFEFGKAGQLPVMPHDIPLDTIITEQSTY